VIEFTLTYEGPLPTSKTSAVKAKQAIRRKFHTQIATYWKIGPLSATHNEIKHGITFWDCFKKSHLAVKSGFTFIPVAPQALKLACGLDIVFLRPKGTQEGDPLITHGGDIDNRLKVLFDALRMPHKSDEIPRGDKPQADEQPYFYCLLEDDAQITKISVRTDWLLKPNSDPSAVQLVIGVSLRATAMTDLNFVFGV